MGGKRVDVASSVPGSSLKSRILEENMRFLMDHSISMLFYGVKATTYEAIQKRDQTCKVMQYWDDSETNHH